MIEEIGRLAAITAQVHGVKKHQLPKPTDIRPRRHVPLTTDRAAIARFFSRR